MDAGAASFARVLAEAGEPAPGPRPPGWEQDVMLSRMREDVAARAATWALHAGQRRDAREVYERACQAAGYTPAAMVAPWLADEPPPSRIL
jgi:hypothetical protein